MTGSPTAPGHRENRPSPAPAGQDGFTLIEMLVAMGIFSMLMIMVMATVLSINRATTTTEQYTNMNEQARIAFERLTRELRQASNIEAVTLPSTPGGDTAITFDVDFNGNGVIDTTAADPEVLTYRYDSAKQSLTLTANDASGTAVTRPILADQVSAFSMQFRSSLWQYDTNGDGVTDWTELDAAPGVGNQNGILDAPELAKIDMVAIDMTVMDGPHKQTYETQVDLRNRELN